MSHIDKDDGCRYLDCGEHYRASGYVTVRVHVAYTTDCEPGEDERALWDALEDIISDDFDVVDADGLNYTIERD